MVAAPDRPEWNHVRLPKNEINNWLIIGNNVWYSHCAVYYHYVLLLLVFIFSILCVKTSCYIHKSNDLVKLDYTALTKRQRFILTTHPRAFKQLMIGNKCPLRPSYRSDGWKNDVWGTPYLHNRPQHMSVMHKEHDKSWERGLIATHPQTKNNTYVIACVIKLYLFAPAMKVSRLFKATKAELTLAL